MYKSGLILAGLVGGLLMSGGSAYAATFNDGRDGDVKIVLICGDGSIGQRVDNHQNASGILGISIGNTLNHVLSHEHRECNIG
ncbi:hypothetical protein [Nonomuraea diastatica]|uniref:Uncharacterized protein n=1 Tax=Nonomuraea diastatica TaxID=1848329 RepID=A0A4R4X7H6_9ACTN|nr:hypothetical protein [Nonomuraea diastatica]TDD26388.1 hypothetical protein E1294_00020 [Nonomuraea diastatica]